MKQETKKFKLRGYREKEYFMVYVYDSLKQMRKDADKFGGHNISGVEDNSDALAVVHLYTRVKIMPGKPDAIIPNIGIIRLVKDKLHTHIIAHELIHAAMHHYRLTQSNRKADFGKHNSEKEEDFGVIYAKYFSKMSRQLYRFGYWK